MTFTFTKIKERCRTQCDAAMRLKLSLTEGFGRVVIQRSLDRAYAAIRGGKVTEMEAMTTELEAVVAMYRQKEVT